MDDMITVFYARDGIKARAKRAADAISRFFGKSTKFLLGYVRAKAGNMAPPKSLDFNPPEEKVVKTGELDVKPVRKMVGQSTSYEQEEYDQIQDDYLQCLEEDSVPVYDNLGMTTAKAVAKNQTASALCKVKMLRSFSNLLNNRISI
jgi:hypothetical protein